MVAGDAGVLAPAVCGSGYRVGDVGAGQDQRVSGGDGNAVVCRVHRAGGVVVVGGPGVGVCGHDCAFLSVAVWACGLVNGVGLAVSW
jgi:hypothetical protein